jgi:hypothetical protein
VIGGGGGAMVFGQLSQSRAFLRAREWISTTQKLYGVWDGMSALRPGIRRHRDVTYDARGK